LETKTKEILMPDRENDALSQWVVIDRFGEITTLLAIGEAEFPGVSPRKSLDRRSREILLPVMTKALSGAETPAEATTYQGVGYTVTASPIRIPDGSRIVGAVGVFVAAPASLPPRPLVGTWQWTVDTTGNNVGENASVWDDNLFELHEYPREAIRSSRGPVGDWLTEMLPYEERARVKATVDAALFAGNSLHQLLTFGAVTPRGTRKQLALTGTATPIEDQPGVHFAYGFTREVAAPSTYKTSGIEAVDTGDFARAYLELARETAFAAFDCEQTYTFMTSPSWSRVGLPSPFDGDIRTLAVGDDRTRLQTFVDDARSAEHDDQEFSLRLGDGGTGHFRVAAARVDRDGPRARYLLLSFEMVR
jgi:hypothetical protein